MRTVVPGGACEAKRLVLIASATALQCLEITEHQFEFDVAIEYCASIHSGDAQEANVERVFVGADFRDARRVLREGQAQQLRHLRRRQHELKDATIGNMAADAAIFAQHPQNDGRGRVNRLEGLDPRW